MNTDGHRLSRRRFICVYLWYSLSRHSLSVNESDLRSPEAYGFDSFTSF
jgi:hypothetical protein